MQGGIFCRNDMADILRVTTPLVNRSQQTDMKRNVEFTPTQFFPIDVGRVQKSTPDAELTGQHNTLGDQEETSAMLLSLLKDPSVTVGFLKNIFMMEQMIRLLPMSNEAYTKEIEQLFKELLVSPDGIAEELVRQEAGATMFRGEMFDFLYGLVKDHPGKTELYLSVVNLLKSLNQQMTKGDIQKSIVSSLAFLRESFASSRQLSGKIDAVLDQFRADRTFAHFDENKRAFMGLCDEIKSSILYTDKVDKVLSMMLYNLSRYNGDPDYLQQSIDHLLAHLRGRGTRDHFMGLLEQFAKADDILQEKPKSAQEVLADILSRQAGSEELMLANAEKIEKIISSLLSSPCNYTPLMHFVVPVEYMDTRSFAEIWINPNGEEDERGPKPSTEKTVHMLFVMDIGVMGRFEVELYARDEHLDIALFCPPGLKTAFGEFGSLLPGKIEGLPYKLREVKLFDLERARSLMDVFRSLPYKRTGFDVTI